MKVEKLLIAVTGGTTDKDVLLMATTLARRFNATIYAIYVIEVKRSLPIDAEVGPEIEKGEGLLDSVEQWCENAQVPVETALLQTREVGPAIVDEAVERGVDGIFMGISQRKRPGEGDLGSAASYVLKNAPCRVWLSRGRLVPENAPTTGADQAKL
ncbi:MAG TPA: universal stress protein [Chloroflexota bacterium]|nr:universal stress protein [Chloroflexota bacterium]